MSKAQDLFIEEKLGKSMPKVHPNWQEYHNVLENGLPEYSLLPIWRLNH